MDLLGDKSKTTKEKEEKLKNLGRLDDLEKNPCFLESQMSYNCLEQSKYDPNFCQDAFSNYRNCKKFWGCVQRLRTRNQEKPRLPLLKDREEAKAKYADRFVSYDFKNDKVFTCGWKKLQESSSQELSDDLIAHRFLTAKIFYFSKKHGLTPKSTKRLNESVLHQTSVPDNSDVCVEDPNTPTDTFQDQTMSTKDQAVTTEDMRVAIEDNPPYPSSFKEVMKCIESGVDIPGVGKITVEPTNDNITKCDASMPKKPWER